MKLCKKWIKKIELLVESTVKDFNKHELEVDNKLIKNKLDKIHEQYELGLKIALKAKNKLVHQLEQQLQKATSSMTQRIRWTNWKNLIIISCKIFKQWIWKTNKRYFGKTRTYWICFEII